MGERGSTCSVCGSTDGDILVSIKRRTLIERHSESTKKWT
jgi:hypothetical protein